LSALLLFTVIILPTSLLGQSPSETVKHEASFYYTVKKGDTLWDISEKFFDTPWYWPDLWQQNSKLPNPHWIYPGDRLHLYMKDGVVYVEKIEPQATAPVALVKKPQFSYAGIEQVGFIRKPPVSPQGVIFKVKDDREMISIGDMIYITPTEEGDLTPGSRFTVFRTLDPIANPENKDDTIGVQHYLLGIVEIMEKKDSYVIATVVKSFRTIQINDKLMPYEPRSTDIFLSEAGKDISGSLLGTEEQNNLIGDNTIAFIDKGEKDGVSVGQVYYVYNQESKKISSKDEKPVYLAPIDIGSLLVILTEENTSTVLVKTSDREMQPGIKFHATMN
jgi:hypothetical protein